MELAVAQADLARGLALVGRAVATRTTLPITQNVLLVAEESRLKLSATNLEIAITTWVGARVEEEGSLTLPARLLTGIVKALPNKRIVLAGKGKPATLEVQCGRFQVKLDATYADEFPPIPTVDGKVTAKVHAQPLRAAIGQVVFAAATEASRPVLTGIQVEFAGDEFVFAATDGFRLAVHRGRLAEPASESTKVIIPAKTFLQVKCILQGYRPRLGEVEEPVEFTINSSHNQVLIRWKSAEMVSQLTHGTFPDYSQFIPKEHTTRAVVNLRDFLRATRIAAVVAGDDSGNVVRLQFFPGSEGAPGHVEVSSRAKEIGENKGSVDAKIEGQPAKIEGQPAKIAFSSRYLTEVLGALQGDEVTLESTTASSPGVFRPVGDKGYIHVLMPMYVQW